MNKTIGIVLAVMAAAIAGTFTPQLLHTAYAQFSGSQLTIQQHLCAAAGGGSAIMGCGNAMSTNSLINSGGTISSGTGTGTGISASQTTGQSATCESAGGNSPITSSCSATSTNTIDNSGGVIR